VGKLFRVLPSRGLLGLGAVFLLERSPVNNTRRSILVGLLLIQGEIDEGGFYPAAAG
jgi:hypothetical protein